MDGPLNSPHLSHNLHSQYCLQFPFSSSRDVVKSRLPANFTGWKRAYHQLKLQTKTKLQLSKKASLTNKKACLSFPYLHPCCKAVEMSGFYYDKQLSLCQIMYRRGRPKGVVAKYLSHFLLNPTPSPDSPSRFDTPFQDMVSVCFHHHIIQSFIKMIRFWHVMCFQQLWRILS